MLTVYSKENCPFCVQAKNYLKNLDIDYQEVRVDQDSQAREFIVAQGHRTVPQIYQDGELFVAGGWQGLSKLNKQAIQQRIVELANSTEKGPT